MSSERRPARIAFALLVLAGVVGALLAFNFTGGRPQALLDATNSLSMQGRVERAWRLAQQSGRYRFATAVEQVTTPAPSVTNTGSTARTDRLFMQGSVDRPANTLELTLWNGDGNASAADTGIAIRMANGRTYGRSPGADWQPMADQTLSFAPDNDPTAFLAAVQNVTDLGSDTRALPGGTTTFQRAHFDIDRPAMARFMRDRMEQRLREAGKLPANLSLGDADQFNTIAGSGEVWLDDAGLPVRLSVNLELPEQANGDRVTASVSTDMSDFDRSRVAAPAASANPLGWAGYVTGLGLLDARGWRQFGGDLSALLLVVALMVAVVVYARSRRVYGVITVVVIVSMLLVPQLQAQQAHAFFADQATQAAAQRAEQADAQRATAQKAALTGPAWDPHAPPSAQVAAPPAAADTPVKPALPPDGDADGDGLTNIQEERLGLEPEDADTDGDDITDNAEVVGFRPTGAIATSNQDPLGHLDSGTRLWYSDPNSADSDADGIIDAVECPARVRSGAALSNPSATCPDSDLDGVPNIFDLDDDNDGVINKVDLSPSRWLGSANSDITKPITNSVGFNRTSPLKLTMSGLTPEKPVFVDFQLQPKDPKHLTYAMNVLDWPSGDTLGQIQRTKNTTLSPDVSGDMQLLPMLEISIPYEQGLYGNLPISNAVAAMTPKTPTSSWLNSGLLKNDGISVSQRDDGSLAAYIPLSLVTDQTGANRVAFSARMRYTPHGANWGAAHEVRLLWALQMKVDNCDASNMPDSVRDGKPEVSEKWCLEHRVESTQIVHQYYDDWYLSGMTVEEDQGASAAILYEDPAKDKAPVPSALSLLGDNLAQVFVKGRDCDSLAADGKCVGDGKRDITVATMAGRFDYTLNAALSNTDKAMGLQALDDAGGQPLNIVRVDAGPTYADQPDALADLATVRVSKVLNDRFGNAGPASPPLLMFAMEHSFRAINVGDTGRAPYTNGVLAISAGGVEPVVEASINWKAYQKDSAGKWGPMQLTSYFDLIKTQYKKLFQELDTAEDPEVTDGRALFAASYDVMLYQGTSGIPQLGERILGPDFRDSSDVVMGQKVAKGTKAGGKGIKFVVKKLVDGGKLDSLGKGITKIDDFYKALGARGASATSKLKTFLSTSKRVPQSMRPGWVRHRQKHRSARRCASSARRRPSRQAR